MQILQRQEAAKTVKPTYVINRSHQRNEILSGAARDENT